MVMNTGHLQNEGIIPVTKPLKVMVYFEEKKSRFNFLLTAGIYFLLLYYKI